MKNLIIIAITAASLVAVAQTSTTAPKAPMAKKAKATAAKTAVKPVQATTTEAAPTPIPTSMLAPEGEKTVTPSTTPSTAAGTSTTAVSAAAPVKAWKGSVSVTPSQFQADPEGVQVLTKTGMSYKVSEKLSVKVAQTFETLNAANNMDPANRELIDRSNFRSAYTDVSLSTTGSGILGSNALPISFNYKKMTGDALIAQKTTFATVDSIVDLNLSIPYTLNPKFDLSIDTQARHYINDNAAKSSYRFLVIPSLSYNVNDKWSVYQGAGMIVSLKDNADMRRNYERLSLSTGVGYAATKSLSFDVNVSQDKALYINPVQKLDITPFSLYKTSRSTSDERTFDYVGYEATVAYSF